MPRKPKLQDIEEDSIWNFRGVRKNKRKKVLKAKVRLQQLLVQAPVTPKAGDTGENPIHLDSPEIIPDTPPFASSTSQITPSSSQPSMKPERNSTLTEIKEEERPSSTKLEDGDLVKGSLSDSNSNDLTLPNAGTVLDKVKTPTEDHVGAGNDKEETLTLKLIEGAGDGFFKEEEDETVNVEPVGEFGTRSMTLEPENIFSQEEMRDEMKCATGDLMERDWADDENRAADELSEKDEEETVEEVEEVNEETEGEIMEEEIKEDKEKVPKNSFNQSKSKLMPHRQSDLSFPGLKKDFKNQRQSSLLLFFTDPKSRGERFVAEPSSSKTSKPRIQPQQDYNSSSGNTVHRRCPFYKWIPGTNFTVDAFRYGTISGCSAYFLTHFHYDHYGGLTRHFKQSIYCSRETANLVVEKLRVDRSQICSLDWNIPTDVEGTKVTLMDANHCPGAAMILFELPSGLCHLHTGDFRASMELCQRLSVWRGKVDNLYLDTTYCDPTYTFPPQQEAIEAVKRLLEAEGNLSRTLVLCGSYTIGKERIFMAAAETLQSLVFVRQDKRRVLRCLEDPQLNSVLTSDEASTNIHVVPMAMLRSDKLTEYRLRQKRKFDRVIAFKPTGWTHSDTGQGPIHRVGGAADSVIYGVSYSEHSSFTELRHFVRTIRPRKIVPTVNVGNASARESMNQLFSEWLEKC